LMSAAITAGGWFVGGPKAAVATVSVCLILALIVQLVWPKRSIKKSAELAESVKIEVNPVFNPVFSPVQSNTQKDQVSRDPFSVSAPSAETKPRLQMGEVRVAAVGYDIHGVWREWIGDYEGIVLEVRNAAGDVGETVATATDLVVSIGTKNATIDRPNLVATAYWLGHEGNEIDLRPGARCDALLAIRESQHDVLSFYENRKRHGAVYIGRRAMPRSMPTLSPIGSVPVLRGVEMQVRLLNAERGETLLSKIVQI
jgi:hypothetical protein